MAIDGINNNIMTKKYGPNWRNIREQIESEKKKKEREKWRRYYEKMLGKKEVAKIYDKKTL